MAMEAKIISLDQKRFDPMTSLILTKHEKIIVQNGHAGYEMRSNHTREIMRII